MFRGDASAAGAAGLHRFDVGSFRGAAAHNGAGQVTFAQQTIAGPGKTILQARQTCDFEAVLAWAAGIASRQNFKVSQLENPYRLVIDVKQ